MKSRIRYQWIWGILASFLLIALVVKIIGIVWSGELLIQGTERWRTNDEFILDGEPPQASNRKSAIQSQYEGIAFWASWSGSDRHQGRLASPTFEAPPVLGLYLSGYPQTPGNRIFLSRIRDRERYPLIATNTGETWKEQRWILPEEWQGDEVRLIAVDNSLEPQGWIGVSSPIQYQSWQTTKNLFRLLQGFLNYSYLLLLAGFLLILGWVLKSSLPLAEDNSKFWLYISSIAIITLILRVPGILKDLPPYLFCDEEIWLGQVRHLLTQGSIVPSEFRSGAISIIPVLLPLQTFYQLSGIFPSDALIVVFARLLLITLGHALASIVAGVTAKLITNRNIPSYAASLFVAFSPAILGHARHWYPDHFIIFPSALLVLILVRFIFGEEFKLRSILLLGFTWAFLLSTKYTTIAVVIPIFLVTIFASTKYATTSWDRILFVFKHCALITLITITFFAILNYGILYNPQKFIDDFLFNIHNYDRPGGSYIASFAFYLRGLVPSTFGIGGTVLLLIGLLLSAWRNYKLPTVLLSFPIALVGTLSTSAIVVSRNTVVAIPFLIPFFVLGLDWLLKLTASSFNRKCHVLSITCTIILTSLITLPIESLSYVANDFQPDSRRLAKSWLEENVPEETLIGINDTCSGLSAAEVAGFSTIKDPGITNKTDLYVINSYWGSTFREHYSPSSDQRYWTFYRLGNTTLYTPWSNVPGLKELLPSGFVLRKVFSSNGPDIIIIERKVK